MAMGKALAQRALSPSGAERGQSLSRTDEIPPDLDPAPDLHERGPVGADNLAEQRRINGFVNGRYVNPKAEGPEGPWIKDMKEKQGLPDFRVDENFYSSRREGLHGID